MQFDQDLYGSVPVIKKYQFAATIANIGIPFLIPAAAGSGLVQGTTTGATDLVGMNIDKGSNILGGQQSTYTTTQGTGSSAERAVSVIINPFAVWSGKMSGGATEDTALAQQTVTTASSGGTAVTTAPRWTSSIEYADGVVWGYTGANAGRYPQDHLDLEHGRHRHDPVRLRDRGGRHLPARAALPDAARRSSSPPTCTRSTRSISVGTGAPYKCIELRLRDSTDSGTTNSFVLFISNSHALNLA
jgi:hypothetical protein